MHLPGGPVGPASRWATTSIVAVGHTTYPVNGERVGVEGREESEGQSHKEEREGGSEMGGALARYGGGLYLDICARARVSSNATADGAGLLIYLARVRLKIQSTPGGAAGSSSLQPERSEYNDDDETSTKSLSRFTFGECYDYI